MFFPKYQHKEFSSDFAIIPIILEDSRIVLGESTWFYLMVGGEEGLVAKEKFEQRHEGSGDSQRGNSVCEGPEAGACSRLSGNDNGRACFGQAGLST